MVSLSLRSYAYGFNVGLIFFGWFCIVYGYLIFRSDYLPKALGILLQVAGLSYLINSFALLLAPGITRWLGYSLMAPVLMGEASLCLWLLVKGVNVERWKTQAGAQPDVPIFLLILITVQEDAQRRSLFAACHTRRHRP